MSWTAPQPALGLSDRGLSDRLALIVEGLCRALGVRSAKDPALAALMLLAWTRLRRLSARFALLVAAVRAGRLAAAPTARVRAAPALSPLPNLPPPYRLPRGFGWMLRLAPETAAYRGQVEYWLADPELASLLAGAPQAGRILRPLCRMLAICPGPALRKQRRERQAAAPAVLRRDALPGSRQADTTWSAEPPRPCPVLAGADPWLGPPAPD